MARDMPRIAVVHYSAPPVVGGVESVILAHVRLLLEVGYPITVVAGKGERQAFPSGAEFVHIPEMDSRHPQVGRISQELEMGRVPDDFGDMVTDLDDALTPLLHACEFVVVHNVFTKHFNLPLTAALFRLLDEGIIRRCIAWCHDFTWTSPHSRANVHPGYTWDLLRSQRPDVTYVTISQSRRRELAELFGCPPQQIRVVYNGVNPDELLGISDLGMALIDRLELWDSDLNLLMPVRVTQAKNIELAVRLVAALRERGVRPKLVVTGPPDPHDRQNMAYFHDLKSLRHQLNVDRELSFVYESGPEADKPFLVDMPVIGELFRVSDALFMPSHREGFGMPIVEAGLAGIPVFCADNIPAANEIGGGDVVTFSPDTEPGQLADLILGRIRKSAVYELKRRVRQSYTWRTIFRHEILPLLGKGTT
jgi:glycosyltransferase involved in cell wall biosynthesis